MMTEGELKRYRNELEWQMGRYPSERYAAKLEAVELILSYGCGGGRLEVERVVCPGRY